MYRVVAPAHRKLKSLVLIALLCPVVLGLAVQRAGADSFDWHNLNGKNYLSPVRYQGPVATCWAFAAVGVLEAKFEVTFNNPDLDLDLSEQHLICDGTYGSTIGGNEFGALMFFRDTGIVSEEELPFEASDYSPNWPLAPGWENRVYKVTEVETFIEATTTYGPLLGTMNTHYDWFWPNEPAGSSQTPAGYEEPVGVPDGNVGWINHGVVVTGYVDDPTVEGGGYWIVKNSWGTDWGDDGYGYIRYGVLESHNRIHAIVGDAYFAPEPSGVAVLLTGLILLRRRRRVRG